jgi:hypothetical protein
MKVTSCSKRNCPLLGNPALHVHQTAYTLLTRIEALMRKLRCGYRLDCATKEPSHRWYLTQGQVNALVLTCDMKCDLCQVSVWFTYTLHILQNLFPEFTVFNYLIKIHQHEAGTLNPNRTSIVGILMSTSICSKLKRSVARTNAQLLQKSEGIKIRYKYYF